MPETPQRWKLLNRRNRAAILVIVGFSLTNMAPAAAAESGAGTVTGVETQLDAAGPPISPGVIPPCLLVQDGQDTTMATDNISAQYDLDATGTFTANDGNIIYAGSFAVEIKTNATFYVGPQGTHYDATATSPNCRPDNLGVLSPIPATFTVTSTDVTCTGSGHFSRTQSAFAAGASLTCDVDGNVPLFDGSATNDGSHFAIDGVQQPLPFPPQIVGNYVQT